MRADAARNRASILAAAQEVFAEHGPSASTEEVATRAGVAIGTVFRHFPTKQALLQAIMKDLLERLTDQASRLAAADPATALFAFFTELVDRAANTKTVVDLLAQAGTSLDIGDALRSLRGQVAELLALAHKAGTVRPDVRVDEVLALLTSTCQGAVSTGWPPDLRHRTLAIIFAGLGSPGR